MSLVEIAEHFLSIQESRFSEGNCLFYFFTVAFSTTKRGAEDEYTRAKGPTFTEPQWTDVQLPVGKDSTGRSGSHPDHFL